LMINQTKERGIFFNLSLLPLSFLPVSLKPNRVTRNMEFSEESFHRKQGQIRRKRWFSRKFPMKSFVGKIESIPRSLPTKYGHFLRKSVSDLFQGQFLGTFRRKRFYTCYNYRQLPVWCDRCLPRKVFIRNVNII
jgi:hypothetical protein